MSEPRTVRVVAISPSDVAEERKALVDVVLDLNRGVAADHGIRLDLWDWERDARPGFHPDGPQGIIDPILRIAESDLVIGILWRRFGTPTATAASGTEHEFRAAYEARKAREAAGDGPKGPDIMWYFNQAPVVSTTSEEAAQHAAVLRFKENVP